MHKIVIPVSILAYDIKEDTSKDKNSAVRNISGAERKIEKIIAVAIVSGAIPYLVAYMYIVGHAGNVPYRKEKSDRLVISAASLPPICIKPEVVNLAINGVITIFAAINKMIVKIWFPSRLHLIFPTMLRPHRNNAGAEKDTLMHSSKGSIIPGIFLSSSTIN